MAAATIRFAEVRRWLFDQALPLWTGPGLDRAFGGSVETLGFSGRDSGLPFKRTRVQARQVYAFSHAHLLGWKGPALESAEHCWRFLADQGRREDGAWVRLVGREGGQLDAAADAYDFAFVLFALAWRLKCGDQDALGLAHETMDLLDQLLGLGPGWGWFAAEDDFSRLSNPHMHLLEASLALAEAGRDERFRQVARQVLSLFERMMFEPAMGVIGEAFDEDWRPVRDRGRRIWPGHHYEWAWLLCQARDITDLDHTGEALALYGFAEARGLDRRMRLADDSLEGAELKPTGAFRIWPQAEALKAHLAMFEHLGLDTRARIAEVVDQLLDRYLAVEPAGGWQDRFGAGFEPLARDIPASILYHLMLAFSELMRLEPQLSGPALVR